MNIRLTNIQSYDDDSISFEDERTELRFAYEQNKKKIQQKRKKAPVKPEH